MDELRQNVLIGLACVALIVTAGLSSVYHRRAQQCNADGRPQHAAHWNRRLGRECVTGIGLAAACMGIAFLL